MLGLKVNWDHFKHMVPPSPVLQSLLWLDILVSWIFKRWCVSGSGSSYMRCFFKQLVAMWPSSPQYMHSLFTCCHYLSCSMNGLNRVWPICMGSSFDVYVVAGDGITWTIDNFQCFFYWHSKSLLSQQTTWKFAWLNVDGFGMVSNRSFTLLLSPYWNWLMSVLHPMICHKPIAWNMMHT